MKILFIAPVPPPITGHSLASKVFLDYISPFSNIEVVNLSKQSFKGGADTYNRFFEIGILLKQIVQKKRNKDLKNKIKELVPGALFPEHESNLSSPTLVTCLGKRLDFAISIDNGVMHMLSLSKTPMIVLFGPTNSKKFAPGYKDLIILDSKNIKLEKHKSQYNYLVLLLSLKCFLINHYECHWYIFTNQFVSIYNFHAMRSV